MFETPLFMLNTGVLYVIDDMLPQDNWPLVRREKADSLFYIYLKEMTLLQK